MVRGFSQITRIFKKSNDVKKIRVHPCSPVSKYLSSAPQRLCAKTGFTLLEILVAVSMVGIILATLLGMFTGLVSSSQNAAKKAELYQTGRALMDLLSADIRGFFPLTTLEGETFFIGFSGESQDDQEALRLDFTTTHALPIGIERNPFLSEVGYRVQKNREDSLYTLWRRAEYPPAPPFEEGGREVPVCRILENFRLAFVTKGDTSPTLTGGVVPDAVVLSFTLNLEGERENFVTMVRPMIKY